MPIVEVTCARDVDGESLRLLLQALPHAVSVAVDCPEEPYDGHLQPGDVDIRVRERGPLDSGGLGIVVEVRSKWTESRASNRQERVSQLRKALVQASGATGLGVYLALPCAAWAQDD
ncbi:MAG: hypothetical protein V9G04_08615 [Nocardioides sp.]